MEECGCNVCPECGKCLPLVELKKAVLPDGDNGEAPETPTAKCPMCSCPKTKEQLARGQIEYLKERGAKDLSEIFEGLLSDLTLPMSDVVVIYASIEQAYLILKAEYMMAIFSPDNISTILSFYFTNDITKVARVKAFNLCREKGYSVLGHFPDYIKLADDFNANRFSIPTSAWNSMSQVERWAANVRFLDDMIACGDEIILATRASEARVGSYYWKELEYLYSKGYKVSSNQLRLYK